MKKLILYSMIALILPVSVFGAALDTPERAIKVKNYLQKTVFEIDGVNGIGVGGCNPRTGVEDIRGDFVHCVVIRTATKKAEKYLKGLYPSGTQVRSVFVSVKYIGVIKPQPRMTGGN